MNQKARFELHALNLGKIIGNLLMLEMGARMAIVKLEAYAANRIQIELPQVKEGDLIEVNAFTNADDLNQTLSKYNKRVPANCRVEIMPIVRLRDSLGHGRTFGVGRTNHLRLVKFSKKQMNGKVLAEVAQDMTDEWFQTNIHMLNIAIEKVRSALSFEKREMI